MAESPSHKLGQIIGNVLQEAIEQPLRQLAKKYNLYIDKAGPRACRTGKKVSWEDRFGNSHDLDYVVERGGTDQKRGKPIAFVEVAWRRYTKHSRNKTQEIQGAVGPLSETYRECAPFLGAVLAGEFTDSSRNQLRSMGFKVLHLPYNAVIAAFRANDLDISFDESTSDADFYKMVSACDANPVGVARVGTSLLASQKDAIDEFLRDLEATFLRTIKRVIVIRLYGDRFEYATISDALTGIPTIPDTSAQATPVGFEVRVEYENGDTVTGHFETSVGARLFLQKFL